MLSEHEIMVLLAKKRLRVTSQRIAVYKTLEKIGHACAEDIIELIKQETPEISIATVYNVLESFAQNNIISRIYTGNNRMYFDITPTNHPHMYCEKTHKIVDYMDDELSCVIEEYFKGKSIEGFDLSQVRIQLVGSYN